MPKKCGVKPSNSLSALLINFVSWLRAIKTEKPLHTFHVTQQCLIIHNNINHYKYFMRLNRCAGSPRCNKHKMETVYV